MLKKPLAILCAILVILSSFAACSVKDGRNAAFVFPIESEPRSLDPQITADTQGGIIITNCFEGLVRIGENSEILPGVANNWDISADGLEYIFHLKSDSRWHMTSKFAPILGKDCEKTFDLRVTAHDFVFGLRRAVMPLTASPYASSLFMIKNARQINSGNLQPEQLGVTAVDDFTLKITLANQTTDFLNLLASPVSMPCNEAFFNAVKGKYGLGHYYLLCNGPFYLADWEQGSSLKLLKFKNDKYESSAVPNSVTLKINQDTGKYAQNVSLGVYSAAEISAPSATALDVSGGITLAEYQNITRAICFNSSEKSLNNTSIRLALCKAVDKETLGPGLVGETRTGGLIPTCCTIGQTPYAQLEQTLSAVSFDPQGANKLWSNGLLALDTKQITLALLCPPESETAMRGLIQNWQKILGITLSISVEVVDSAELQKRVTNGNYQIALAPIKANKSAAIDFLQNFESGNPNNSLNYKSATFDNLLDQARTAPGAQEAARFCALAQNEILQSGVVYPLFSQSSYLAMGKGVTGLYTLPAGECATFINAKIVG